jgi:glucosamine-6-phosphate deaminase
MVTENILRLTALSVDELRRQARVPFRLLPDRDALLRDMADAILAEVRAHNRRNEPTRLILPVGPVSQYRRVVEESNREGLSWRRVHVFAMDEFLDWQGRPIPQEHPLSFEGHLRREVFARLDPALRIPDEQIVFPHPFRIDEASEKIRRVGGIDCCFGGIGYHGHIAFNDPPLSRWFEISVEEMRNSLTRVVALGDDSIVVQSIHCSGGNSAAIPPMAVTLGMRDILAARKIRLYCAAGERHRTIFRISVAGEVGVAFPSTLVQGHPDAEVVTDVATAAPIELGLR